MQYRRPVHPLVPRPHPRVVLLSLPRTLQLMPSSNISLELSAAGPSIRYWYPGRSDEWRVSHPSFLVHFLNITLGLSVAGPSIPWYPGRSDKADGSACPPDGRLPDADKGAPHIREIFNRMGFNDQVRDCNTFAVSFNCRDLNAKWGSTTRCAAIVVPQIYACMGLSDQVWGSRR